MSSADAEISMNVIRRVMLVKPLRRQGKALLFVDVLVAMRERLKSVGNLSITFLPFHAASGD